MMSNAFKGLYFREWKMMRGFFIGQFIVFLVMFLMPLGSTLPDKLVQLLILTIIIVPAAVMFSLNTEVNQMELFLHNPQSIHKLLFVKFLNGFVFAMSYAFVLIISVTIVDLIWPTFQLSSLAAFWYLLSFTLRLIISTIPFMVMLLFLWTLHQIFRKYIGAFFSLIIVVAVLIGGIQLINFMSHTGFYQSFVEWGAIEMPFSQEYTSLYVNKNSVGLTVYLGSYIFYGVISMLLYFISTYLIDHKVEV